MSIQKIIQEAINKNPHDLKEALEEELRDRIRLALEAKMSDEEDDDSSEEDEDEEDDDEEDMKKESVEQIDELKKSTLASYVSKAADNAATHGMKYGEKKAQSDEMDRMMNRHMSYSDKDQVRKIMKTTSDDVDAPRRKAAKRLKGIDLAVKKLSKD
jgi:hypothetical protein